MIWSGDRALTGKPEGIRKKIKSLKYSGVARIFQLGEGQCEGGKQPSVALSVLSTSHDREILYIYIERNNLLHQWLAS